MAVQRTLKAAGTYAAQKVIHGRGIYLPYLSRALKLTARNLDRCPDLDPLRKALAHFLEEFREAAG